MAFALHQHESATGLHVSDRKWCVRDGLEEGTVARLRVQIEPWLTAQSPCPGRPPHPYLSASNSLGSLLLDTLRTVSLQTPPATAWVPWKQLSEHGRELEDHTAPTASPLPSPPTGQSSSHQKQRLESTPRPGYLPSPFHLPARASRNHLSD